MLVREADEPIYTRLLINVTGQASRNVPGFGYMPIAPAEMSLDALSVIRVYDKSTVWRRLEQPCVSRPCLCVVVSRQTPQQ